MISMYLVWK